MIEPIRFRLVRPFTGRQHQIATLIGDGKSYQEIADALGMKRNTVLTHVRGMAVVLDDDGDAALEPRLRIFAYVQWRRWEARRKIATSSEAEGNAAAG